MKRKDSFTYSTIETHIVDEHGVEWHLNAHIKGEVVADSDGLEASHPYRSHGSKFYVTNLSVYDILCVGDSKTVELGRPLIEDMPNFFSEHTLNKVRALAREKLLEETLNKY